MRLAIIVTVLAFPVFSHAATINVPAGQPSIQAGIDAAVNGDTVLVAPGTYLENIDFMEKKITVKSEYGPVVTVIDANYNGPVVRFDKGEGQSSVIDGFTLRYGKAKGMFGGGIYCKYSSPVIKNNIVYHNSAEHGGGIYCESFDVSPLIINNLIIENSVHGDGGGILCDWYTAPKIINNLIINNSAGYHGGAISCLGGCAASIINNTICNNYGYHSSGIYIQSGPVTVCNTIVWDNIGSPYEIYSPTFDPTIIFNDIKGGWPGTGNIDADPLFLDQGNSDFHLTFNSPCKDSADNSALELPSEDFEGDPRIAYATVDMGADEFHPHLYYTGNAITNGYVELKFVGIPGTTQVGLIGGSNLFDPPLLSTWGAWYIAPPMYIVPALPSIPPDGVGIFGGTIPAIPPGPYTVYFQGMIGWELSNLCVLCIE